ncbi:YHYH protein [Alteromonas lipotrueae]|uniref:YHYH protein n=1 Tax=Alteromonas lipotrueae TaxID=2803814 RepID=UPI001C47B233|nr:YHYH protein [Alteromonas lipotrueae]
MHNSCKIVPLAVAIALAGCYGDQSDAQSDGKLGSEPESKPESKLSAVNQEAREGNTSAFNNASLVTPVTTVDCTLEDGSSSACMQITVKHVPDDLEIGPFCPTTLDDEGGVWGWTGENAGTYRINASFLKMLNELGYHFYDDDGSVHVVDTLMSAPEEDNTCINVALDDSVTMTMLIPTEPKKAASATHLDTVAKVGVGLDGVPIFADAPSIQETGHMPALDACGGHVDPGGYYHWHATASDIDTAFATEGVTADCHVHQDSSAQFGYAFDGYPILGSTDNTHIQPEDLDECNGHTGALKEGEAAQYHYHASTEFPNLPTCLVGVPAADNFSTTAKIGIGSVRPEGQEGPQAGHQQGPQSGRMPPGFGEAAEALGISEQALMEALKANGGRNADLSAVAADLGVSEADLKAALPKPPKR